MNVSVKTMTTLYEIYKTFVTPIQILVKKHPGPNIKEGPHSKPNESPPVRIPIWWRRMITRDTFLCAIWDISYFWVTVQDSRHVLGGDIDSLMREL